MCGNRLADPYPLVLGRGTTVVHDEWRFIQRQLLDATETAGRLEREHGARGHALQGRGTTRFAHERGDVLDFALHGIGRRVTTLASTLEELRIECSFPADEA